MVNEFLDVLALQPPAWRFIVAVVFAIACGFVMGGILTLAEIFCDATLGSVGLRIRLWRAKRAWRARQRTKVHHVPGAQERLR